MELKMVPIIGVEPYDLRITKASQLQNEYNNEYSNDNFLNKT